MVPIESLDRSNPGSASKGKEEINGKKKKSKSWFGHIPGVGGSTKEERTLKKYWRFVGFKVSTERPAPAKGRLKTSQ